MFNVGQPSANSYESVFVTEGLSVRADVAGGKCCCSQSTFTSRKIINNSIQS